MIFDLLRELEITLSDITFTGINNIDYNVIDKLNLLSKNFEKIAMNHLKDLLIEFIESIKNYKTNKDKKNTLKIVSNNISKIEFYLKNALSFE